MENNLDDFTLASIDTLIEYKKGMLTLDEAVTRFSFLTGISAHVSREHISSLKRDNLIHFNSYLTRENS